MDENVGKMKSRNSAAQQLRQELQDGDTGDLRRRRGIVALSLIGMASMAAVTLYQMGLIRHLPDPPLSRFDSDRVNASDTAYQYGVPDGTLTLAGHATNAVMAAFGGIRRAAEQPWVPIAASGKAGVEAAIAAKYLFYQMPVVEKKWCGYCIVDALMHIGSFALTLPEAARAVSAMMNNRSLNSTSNPEPL
ncbi:MAG: vitamin K epoxide reductase family protein [Nitrospirota bacterium]|nr:vitamin K epoxide reductase family protein [Nitrospirota bacterium]